jgi:hypothetical protein
MELGGLFEEAAVDGKRQAAGKQPGVSLQRALLCWRDSAFTLKEEEVLPLKPVMMELVRRLVVFLILVVPSGKVLHSRQFDRCFKECTRCGLSHHPYLFCEFLVAIS